MTGSNLLGGFSCKLESCCAAVSTLGSGSGSGTVVASESGQLSLSDSWQLIIDRHSF